MCDWFSYGIASPELRKQLGLKSKYLFLEDDMAEALIARGDNPDPLRANSFTWQDVGGHHAISAYYRILPDAFTHEESSETLPRAIAARINSGAMDKIQRKTFRYARPLRYTTKGKLKVSKYDHTYENPEDNILAIRRHCDEIGKPELAEPAIAAFQHGTNRIPEGPYNIDNALTWAATPPSAEFWGVIWFKMTGQNRQYGGIGEDDLMWADFKPLGC